MKKEVIIAVLLGISLGFVVTFGIWKARVALKTLPPKVSLTPTPTATSSPPLAPASPELVITSPRDFGLTSKENITVDGKAEPNSPVIILTEDKYYSTISDEKGNFSQEIVLIGGENEIFVANFDKDGNDHTASLTIVFSTAEI